MNSIRYKKIDAFTSPGSQGNPAACLFLQPDQRLDDRDMQDIAGNHRGFVSEVVFCSHDHDGLLLSYYSSECEVDFCGHGTIACMYSLVRDTPELMERKTIPVRTNKKGTITVYNDLRARDAVFISAPEPRHIGTNITPADAAEALGLGAGDVASTRPVDIIDAGLRTLIVPVEPLAACVSVFPDQRTLGRFCERNDVDIVLIHSLSAREPFHKAHTRVFAPRFGYLEDPATGSGNSAFGYYMLKNGLWDGRDCSIEQGGDDRVFNTVKLGTRDGKVVFGGSATTRIDGMYYH